MVKEKKPPAIAAAADVIEAMGDGLIVTDLDCNIISVNKAMEEYFTEGGVDVKKFIGKSALDLPLVRPEDVEKYVGLIKEVIEKGRAGPLETRGTTGRWDSITVSLLKDAEGNPSALFAVVRDITEFKRAEEERAKAMAEKAELIDVMADNIVVCDLDTNILMVNKIMEKRLAERGIVAKELIGKPIVDVMPFVRREDTEKYVGLIKEATERDSAGSIEVAARNGKWLSIAAYRLKDAEGNPSGFFTLGRDITELKRAEEERTRAAAVAGTIDAMLDPVLVFDLEGRVVFTNRAFSQMFGLKHEDYVGKFIMDIPGMEKQKPELVKKIMPLFIKTVEKGAAGPVEAVIVRKIDDREIPVSIAGAAIKDAQGNPTHLVAVLRDITKLKRAEEGRLKREKVSRISETITGDIIRKFGVKTTAAELGLQDILSHFSDLVAHPSPQNLFDLLVAGTHVVLKRGGVKVSKKKVREFLAPIIRRALKEIFVMAGEFNRSIPPEYKKLEKALSHPG